MKYELVKIDGLSGKKVTIYSIRLGDDQNTLLENFVERYDNSHKSEIEYILNTLEVISTEQGYREIYFKQMEGPLFEPIEALYDKPNSNLRLYCINLGKTILIFGDGGIKPKNIRALQENEELKVSNYFLRQVIKEIDEKIKEKEIYYSADEMELLGNLTFGEEDE